MKKIDNISASMASVSTTKYGMNELLKEIAALGDSFLLSLESVLSRRKSIIDAYDNGPQRVADCIGEITSKLNNMKKGFENE